MSPVYIWITREFLKAPYHTCGIQILHRSLHWMRLLRGRKTQTSLFLLPPSWLAMCPMNTRLASRLMNLIFSEISRKRARERQCAAAPSYRVVCGIHIVLASFRVSFRFHNFTFAWVLLFLYLSLDISKFYINSLIAVVSSLWLGALDAAQLLRFRVRSQWCR